MSRLAVLFYYLHEPTASHGPYQLISSFGDLPIVPHVVCGPPPHLDFMVIFGAISYYTCKYDRNINDWNKQLFPALRSMSICFPLFSCLLGETTAGFCSGEGLPSSRADQIHLWGEPAGLNHQQLCNYPQIIYQEI